MQSKMTEREFRERIAASDREAAYLDNAVRVAREAGLEFAPEPVKLPTQLMIGPLGPSGVWIGQNSGGETFSCRNDAARPLAEALVARYNAYPGLREAAERLVQRVIGSTAACPLDLLQALDAELAKGPK